MLGFLRGPPPPRSLPSPHWTAPPSPGRALLASSQRSVVQAQSSPTAKTWPSPSRSPRYSFQSSPSRIMESVKPPPPPIVWPEEPSEPPLFDQFDQLISPRTKPLDCTVSSALSPQFDFIEECTQVRRGDGEAGGRGTLFISLFL